MLDAYIIDRIRREQQERAHRQERLPLHIERPMPLPPAREAPVGSSFPPGRTEDEPQERGSIVIDFCI